MVEELTPQDFEHKSKPNSPLSESAISKIIHANPKIVRRAIELFLKKISADKLNDDGTIINETLSLSSSDNSISKKDIDFTHYDEIFHYLHYEFDGKNRIDYWTGFYSNRPALKALIFKTFNYYFNTITFANLA